MSIYHFVTAAVFIASLSSVHSLVCHEGFNVSISGIPLYYWAEHECLTDSECFIQEIAYAIPGTKMKDIVLRFGGCISKPLSPYITCEHVYGDSTGITVDIAFDILRGLADKLSEFENKRVTDITHSPQFFSRGKSPDEFLTGGLEFLESIGYDRTKIGEPFKKFAQSILIGSYVGQIPNWEQWEPLVQAAKVDNDATKRLSGALLSYTKLLDGHAPDNILRVSIYGPGLAYPILHSEYPADEINDFYFAMAQGFENPTSTMSEEYHKLFISSLLVMQFSASEIMPESSKTVYQKTKKILDSFKEMYPDSPHPDVALIESDMLYKYATEMNSLPSCDSDDFDCASQNVIKRNVMVAKKKLQQTEADFRKNMTELRSLVELLKTMGGAEIDETEIFAGVKDVEKLFKIFREWLEKIAYINFKSNALFELLDPMQPVLNNLGHITEEMANEFREKYSPDTCKHLPCTETLCNSHKDFLSKKDFDATVHKGEL